MVKLSGCDFASAIRIPWAKAAGAKLILMTRAARRRVSRYAWSNLLRDDFGGVHDNSYEPGAGLPTYLQSTLLSCAAAICHLASRFNQVSVQTWHTFALGRGLSLPMECSLPEM